MMNSSANKSMQPSQLTLGELTAIVEGRNHRYKTFGIVSASDPFGKPAPAEANEQAEKRLEELLAGKYPSSCKIRSYRTRIYECNSYLIPGISREEIINLGSEFNQEFVIFSEVQDETGGTTPEKGEHLGSKFELILTDEERKGNVLLSRDVLLALQEDDLFFHMFYEKIGDELFSIPFFNYKYFSEDERKHYSVDLTQPQFDWGDEEEEEENVFPFDFEIDDHDNNLGDFFIEQWLISEETKKMLLRYSELSQDAGRTDQSQLINRRYLTMTIKSIRKALGCSYKLDPIEDPFDDTEEDETEC